jgi:hypothetical protein
MLEDAGSDAEQVFDESFQKEIDDRREQIENPPAIKSRGKPDEATSLLEEF